MDLKCNQIDTFTSDQAVNGINSESARPKQIKPLPEMPKVSPLDKDCLPLGIRDYVFDAAYRMQCAVDYVSVAAIAALSSLLGRKILICPKERDNWVVTPNLWSMSVGRSSAMKSPALKAALTPILEYEIKAAEEYKLEAKKYSAEVEYSKAMLSKAKSSISNKKNPASKDDFIRSVVSEDVSDDAPSRKRYVVYDVTVEKLGEILTQNQNGVLQIRDELYGLLSKLQKEEYQTDRAFYLECFEGSNRFTYDRIGRGTVDIENCTISFLGGIQPSKILPVVRAAQSGHCDDGLIQRFQLSVWPDKIQRGEIIVDEKPNAQAYEIYKSVFDKFHSLPNAGNETDIPKYHFSTEAQKIFNKWYIENRLEAEQDDIHPVYESYLLKLPATTASVALLYSVIDTDDKHVGSQALVRALGYIDYIKTHANRLMSAAIHSDVDGAKLILKRRSKLAEEFTLRDIQRKNWSGLNDWKSVNEAIECLLDHNYIFANPNEFTGGRPSTTYRWNPISK